MHGKKQCTKQHKAAGTKFKLVYLHKLYKLAKGESAIMI
jgi:hypothetical protein